MIVWTDIESSCLDERQNDAQLMEVAIVATDDNLVERAHISCVCKPVGIEPDEIVMPLLIREMHEKSGLLDALRGEGAMRKFEAEIHIIEWLEQTFGRIEDLRQIPLAGSTISFDRRWLRQKMPKLEALFSYRSIDVSALTELAARWAPAVHNDRPKREAGVAHRALRDVRQSIETLRYYKGRGFVGGLA